LIDKETRERIEELIEYANPTEANRLMDILRMEAEDGQAVDDVSFLDYCKRTCPFELDSWQEHLCEVLQDAADNPGQRILIHKPPQTGGTIIVSERFPAWCIARRPKIRFISAAYNATHSIAFGHAVKNLMLSEDHLEMFPGASGQINKRVSTEMFRTPARELLNDGQYSFLAVGIKTGVTGKGVSGDAETAGILVIDDPYASDDAAASPSTNEATWRFWEKTVKQRVLGATVIVMFHFYQIDDLGARLLAREGRWTEKNQRGWKVYRYALVGDDDPDGDLCPPGRAVGSILTKRRTLEQAKEWEDQDLTGYMSQGQGRPLTSIAQLINPDNFRLWPEDTPPPFVKHWYRGIDMALKRVSPDETGSILLGMMENGDIYVEDIGHWRMDIEHTEDRIIADARADPDGTFTCMYNEVVQLSTISRLRYHERVMFLEVMRKNRGKWACAAGWVGQSNRGRVWFSRSCKEFPYFKVQCSRFNDLSTDRDDLIDAFSAAYEATYKHQPEQQKSEVVVHPDSAKFLVALRNRSLNKVRSAFRSRDRRR